MSSAIDLDPALTSLTTLMRATIESADARRFAIVHKLSKTVQQLMRTVAVRVEDFEDPHRARATPSFFKKGFSQSDLSVAVPETLSPEVDDVLQAITRAIASTLGSDRRRRFAEVERMTETAQAFLAAIAPEPLKKERDDHDAIVCGAFPEETPIQEEVAQMMADDIWDHDGNPLVGGRRPAAGGLPDVNELRRDIITIEGSKVQMEAELLQAQVASAEAAELEHLTAVCRQAGTELSLLASNRITVLKARLELRTKGKTHAVVPTDVSRGHQSGGDAAGSDDSTGHPRHAERTGRPGNSTQEGAFATVGLGAMGGA